MTLTRNALNKALRTFAKDEDGATAIEYALMVALVGAVIVVGVTSLGTSTNTKFSDVATVIDEAGDAPASP
ncbi:Flp family type IVb pilin [Sulfitobacter geojensis]|jgi:pilus assembly protein Flp/PilA|uniref:Flp family type IVb pilin n=1 Tax=Sulfitobacter geojensis TaxID=1342299 RepID=A0AAE2VVS0_9RHOB|nr:Flp family type IVb pilin [Sulfitobacter geojensis]MBM1688298.1 Flp family type IVb pilin [Sulfitobacter geojensis]MBM1692365.1 Flp family type IVb pilin [Sulfitobacter geojensis]MBM1704531.1 Flp family type IVb pilin [Sulfitobacter geojensis]MBM1708589.1 Flp family type IVb pilin [Sulfitobacter geojensis]MBM1712654.1 Flp family type IVb pilin [Sulfitobacter geojensis]